MEQSLMMSTEPIPFVDVGIIMEFPGGLRVPVRIGCAWDRAGRCWSIETMGMANFYEPGRLGPKVF